MSMAKAQELHREMLQHAQAGDHGRVVTVAQQYLDLFGQSIDPEMRSLTAGVRITQLSSQAHLTPSEALQSCDEIFMDYRDVDGPEGPAVAASALRLQIELLLRAGETAAALQAAAQLEVFFEALGEDADIVQPAGQLIAVSRPLIQCDANRAAVDLLRSVIDHLSPSAERDARQMVAVAQLWLILAFIEKGNPAPGAQQIEQLNMQDDATAYALDTLLRELNGLSRWRSAIVLLIAMKVDSLDARGQQTLATETRQGFIQAFEDRWSDIPAVEQLVDRFRSELADS